MKNIQISFNEKLLREIDRVASASGKTRSAIIRAAVKTWLDQKKIRDFENQWIAKLVATPEEIEDSEIWLKTDSWEDE